MTRIAEPAAQKHRMSIWGYAIFAVTFVFLVIRVLVDKRVREYDALDDYFHAGEWFTANVNRLADVPFDTFTIHGGKDLLPAMVLEWIYGYPTYIGAMIPTIKVFTPIIGGLVLLILLFRFAPQPKAALFLAPFAVFAGAYVDHRDLAIFVFMLAFFALLSGPLRPRQWSLLLFSAAVVFSIIYSMNRGAITIGVTVPAVLWLSLREPRYLLVFVYVGAMWVLTGLLQPQFAPVHVIENILFLVGTTHIHVADTAIETDAVIRKIYLAVAYVLMLALSGLRFLSGDRGVQNQTRLLVLGILAAGFYEIGSNRIAWPYFGTGGLFVPIALAHWWHWFQEQGGKATRLEGAILITLAAMAIVMNAMLSGIKEWTWFPWLGFVLAHVALIAAAIGSFDLASLRSRAWVAWLRFAATCGVALVVLAFLLRILTGFQSHVESGRLAAYMSWENFDAMGTPNADVVWVRDQLFDAGATCILDMTNSGMLNAHSRLPTCSRISYFFYADSTYEDELIAALEDADQPVIVYSSTYGGRISLGSRC